MKYSSVGIHEYRGRVSLSEGYEARNIPVWVFMSIGAEFHFQRVMRHEIFQCGYS